MSEEIQTGKIRQYIDINDMTDYERHMSVLRSYLLNISIFHSEGAANYCYDENAKIIKDANEIINAGLFKLANGTKNYSSSSDFLNTEERQEGLKQGFAYIYVIPLPNNYIKQYTVIGDDVSTEKQTRLGKKNGNKYTWSKWRTCSDDNPVHELLETDSPMEAEVNVNYFSFHNCTLVLPDPTKHKIGDSICLDQWRNNGKIICDDDEVETKSSFDRNYYEFECEGLDEEPIIFKRLSLIEWTSDQYKIKADLYQDNLYWVVLNNDTIMYRSVETIFEAKLPTQATYELLLIKTEEDKFQEIISFNVFDYTAKDIETTECITYEFEICNNGDERDKSGNYWFVFAYVKEKFNSFESDKFYEKTLKQIENYVTDIHSRITLESSILHTSLITVSTILQTSLDDVSTLLQTSINDLATSLADTSTSLGTVAASVTSLKTQCESMASSISTLEANAAASAEPPSE